MKGWNLAAYYCVRRIVQTRIILLERLTLQQLCIYAHFRFHTRRMRRHECTLVVWPSKRARGCWSVTCVSVRCWPNSHHDWLSHSTDGQHDSVQKHMCWEANARVVRVRASFGSNTLYLSSRASTVAFRWQRGIAGETMEIWVGGRVANSVLSRISCRAHIASEAEQQPAVSVKTRYVIPEFQTGVSGFCCIPAATPPRTWHSQTYNATHSNGTGFSTLSNPL